MINVHLNGDIVTLPNNEIIQQQRKERLEKEGRCLYGLHEYDCDEWRSYVQNSDQVKKFSEFGRCTFAHCANCPERKKYQEHGRKEKRFRINSAVYRKLSSGAVYMLKTSEFRSLFLTLTLPDFKPGIEDLNEHKLNLKINEAFSKFVENLRANYHMENYIAVRERGERFHRVHFHILVSLPFVPFRRLNDAWAAAISDICHYSKNALRRDPTKPLFVNSTVRAVRYLTKYFSKVKGIEASHRLYFISKELLIKPVVDAGATLEEILKGYKGIYISKICDYATIYRVTDTISLGKFLENYIFPMFELPYGRVKTCFFTGNSP